MGSGNELDASIDTVLIGFIQKFQQHAKGDFVVGMSDSDGVAFSLSTDGAKAALKQKAEDRGGEPVGQDRYIQEDRSGESRIMISCTEPGSRALIGVEKVVVPSQVWYAGRTVRCGDPLSVSWREKSPHS